MIASAHASPLGLRLVFDAEASDRPLVVANRGLLRPRADGGWELLCNEAYGVTPSIEPSVLRAQQGSRLLVANLDAVLLSEDDGCSFVDASPVTEESFTAALAPGAAPSVLYTATGNRQTGNALYRSDDMGESWQTLFDNAEGNWFTSLRRAPSQPDRLYATLTVANFETETLGHGFGVSDDGGESWSIQPIPEQRELVGVHPQAADTVFVQTQLEATEEWALLRSTDGGESFAQVAVSVAQFTALSLSPDGSALWLGAGPGGGLLSSSDDGASFTELPDSDITAVRCLERHGGRLWMCANRLPNREGVWSQPEGGGDWERLLTFDEVQQPVACEGGAPSAVCATAWDDWAYELLGVPYPDADAGTNDAGSAPPADAGTDDAAPTASLDSGPAAAPTETAEAGGGCSTGGAGAAMPWPIALNGLLFLALCRGLPRRVGRGRG